MSSGIAKCVPSVPRLSRATRRPYPSFRRLRELAVPNPRHRDFTAALLDTA